MKLVIDIGNTSIKFGIFLKEQLKKVFIVSTKDKNKISKTIISIRKQYSSFEKIVIGSVAPSKNNLIDNLLKQQYDCKIKILSIDDFSNYFDLSKFNKKEIGLDIVALGVYLQKKYRKAMGICFGTATFCLAIDHRKIIGVSIMPSIELGYEKMFDFTEMMESIKLNISSFNLGKNTKTALSSGMLHMTYGTIMQFYHYLNKKYQIDTAIVTGGKSVCIKKFIDNKNIIYVDNCVLYGYNFF